MKLQELKENLLKLQKEGCYLQKLNIESLNKDKIVFLNVIADTEIDFFMEMADNENSEFGIEFENIKESNDAYNTLEFYFGNDLEEYIRGGAGSYYEMLNAVGSMYNEYKEAESNMSYYYENLEKDN